MPNVRHGRDVLLFLIRKHYTWVLFLDKPVKSNVFLQSDCMEPILHVSTYTLVGKSMFSYSEIMIEMKYTQLAIIPFAII